MLDGAFTSPKIRRLAVILEIPWPHALGLAGLLWRFTAKHAPTGEIGRHDDEEIAAALEWPGDAGDLVAALTRCRLLDPTQSAARLLVHDWPQHAPRYVSASLKRQKLTFSQEYSEKLPDMTSMSCHATTAVPTVVPTAVATAVPTTVETTSSYSSSSAYASAVCDTQTSTELNSGDSEAAGDSVSIQSDEDPVCGAPAVWMDEESSEARNRSDAIVRPLKGWAQNHAEEIWEAYLPGRKSGKKTAIPMIVKSIHEVAKAEGLSVYDAADRIRRAVEWDVFRMVERIKSGETELKFCPLGITYFRQERWNDGDEGPTDHDVREARIDDDLRQARADL